MCGIAGTVSLGLRLDQADKVLVENMTAALRHRGPDSRRVVGTQSCLLGNARLRITDLSDQADLPLSNEDGSVWISFNGAVTNFRELRERFHLDGNHRFRSKSDAEVLVHLYEEIGMEFLEHLNGMFAFCLYDERAAKAFLVRDFYGLRPVFYAARGQRLHFASEIKALLEIPGLDRRLDHQALWHFFSLAYIPGQATPFTGIRELQAGSLIEADLKSGRFAERTYHQVRYDPDPALTEAGCAKTVRALMSEALRRSLDCDAAVGLTLSGGFDTSALLALSKEMGISRKMHTFSLKINEPSFDESRYQKVMVDFARPVHHEIEVDAEDVLENIFSCVAHLDEPSGNGAVVPTFLLARQASRHVRVLLSGEGGDEIFNAYETHRAYKARLLYRRLAPAGLRRLARCLAARLPTSYKKLSLDFLSKRFTQGAELDVPSSHFFWRHTLSEAEKSELWLNGKGRKPSSELFSELFDSLDFDDDLNKISFIDLRYYFIDDLMVKNDRMAMAHGLETRFPYMDRPLVEYAARIPTRLKLNGFRGRHIQKLAMKGLVPKAIEQRQNMGLELPHSLWFLKEFRGFSEKYFSKERLGRSGLLDHEAVQKLWGEHLSRKKDNGRALWCLLNFLIWFDLFVYDGDYKKYLTQPCIPRKEA